VWGLNEKDYEEYLRELSRVDLPGISIHPLYQIAEMYMKYPFRDLYKIENGKIVLNKDWEPQRLSRWKRIKNLLL